MTSFLRTLAVLTVLVAGSSPALAQKAASTPDASSAAADVCETGSAEAFLDAGGVRAALYDTGGLFWRGSGSTYEVPKGSGKNAVFTAGLWVGGQVGGELRFAGATYGNWEYWPGPLDAAGDASADLCAAFDRIWVVTTADLAAFRDSGTAAPDLAAWPVGAGAPFFVDADADGTQGSAEPTVTLRPGTPGYDPARAIDLAAGERPVVFGAQTAWWVMNDRGGEHAWSDGPGLGLETRVTAWTLADNARASLYESTFYRYDILNRSTDTIHDVLAGIFADVDLGQGRDDYVHSDSLRSMQVFYNGDDLDEDGYGVPPALGIDLLSGATTGMYFQGGASYTSDPGSGGQAYGLLRALWNDGTPLREGNDGYTAAGERTRWAFPGDPVTWSFWSEDNADGRGGRNTPSDRRGVLSSEVGRLDPGHAFTLDVGLLFAQGVNRHHSVVRLRGASDDAQAAYASGDLFRAVAATGPPTPPTPPPAPTTAPGLVAPAAAALFDEAPVTFAWTPADGATGYRIEFSLSEDFVFPVRVVVASSPATVPPEAFPPNQSGPLYWRVIPTIGTVAGPPSEPRPITLYHYTPEAMAFVEVVGPGGTDPCGPAAISTAGCAEFFGNTIYVSFNSTADYVGTRVGANPLATIAAFGPTDFEIRFTDEGSFAAYPSTSGAVIRVPFEVWDVGVVTPGEDNDPADDVQMVATLFADSGDECVFEYGGPTELAIGPITQRIATSYAVGDDYAAFAAEAAPLVEADPAGCPSGPVTADLTARIDADRGRPIQGFVLEQASGAGLDALVGTVIRFYTNDPQTPVSYEAPPVVDPPDAGPLAVAIRPNPSASVATVAYQLPEAGAVRLRLFDVLGREVAVLAEGDRVEGEHRVDLDASQLAAGVYVLELRVGSARAVQTMTVAR